MHTVLFSIYAALLFQKNRVHWIPLIAAVSLFSIASADAAYTVNILFGKLFKKGLEYEDLRPKYVMYVVNSEHSCYLVWGSRKWVLAGPVFLLTVATGCGFVFEGTSAYLSQFSWINVSLTLAVNIIASSLTAGRIYYVGRYARAFLGPGVPRALWKCAAVMVESGTIYAIYLSLDLALKANPAANIILEGGLIQVVGIMPILMLVQIALGRASNIGTPSYVQEQGIASGTPHYWSEDTRRTYPVGSDIPMTESVPASDVIQIV
ncbi:hypothetical protein H0H92_009459 [Tricholoma furcatifolium]|nr:hypothetical protein H0H92_009459 [Tricholoma furcatifolium]